MEIKMKEYVIPYRNNKHFKPYGILEIIENDKSYLRKFDLAKNNNYIINHIKYSLEFVGSLYHPKFELKKIRKEI